jgi:hypothetical protein
LAEQQPLQLRQELRPWEKQRPPEQLERLSQLQRGLAVRSSLQSLNVQHCCEQPQPNTRQHTDIQTRTCDNLSDDGQRITPAKIQKVLPEHATKLATVAVREKQNRINLLLAGLELEGDVALCVESRRCFRSAKRSALAQLENKKQPIHNKMSFVGSFCSVATMSARFTGADIAHGHALL